MLSFSAFASRSRIQIRWN